MNGDALLTGNGLVPGFAAFSTETTWWVKDPLTGVPGSVWSNLWMLNRSNLAPFPQLGITNVPAPPGPAAVQSHATGWLPGPGGGPAGSSFAGFFGVGILASGSRAGWFLSSGEGVIGSGATVGVIGEGGTGFGVSGTSFANIGVFGEGPTGTPLPGVMGVGRALPVRDPETRREILSAGVHGLGRQGGFGVGVLGTEGGPGWAGLFDGYTEVRGTLDVRGRLTKQSGGFRIDHPLDPGDKYLQHSFVESPDMKNVYDGVAEIDEAGAASVELPEWFGELNGDYRYQLTAIGEPAPDLHIAEEISDNRFTIAGGRSGMRVSWQVTGIRKDEWAEANPLEVEVEKREEDGARRLPEAELARQTPAEEELQLLRQTPASPVISPTREEMMEEIRRLDEELGSDEKLSTRRPPTPPEG